MKIQDISGKVIYENENIQSLEKLLIECAEKRISLQNADFRKQRFNAIIFENLDLKGADFSNSSFECCDFINCNLYEADFSNCILKFDIFKNNLCTKTIFDNIKLEMIDPLEFHNTFYQCSFKKADFNDCDFRYCSFEECDLNEVIICNVLGDMKQICSLQVDSFKIAFTKDIIAIGCKNESLDWWKKASDDLIKDERNNYSQTWNAYKDILFKIIDIKFGGLR
ncbi:pentapeptide repeat-containing protein [Campylobacter sp. CCS1377]|uniref:Pentapeptide repeat-containing protein n=1 Tax=Campylobacter sp. CCS1377 TaxID=3158229 RepID=A0AAU7E5D5_9BACT